MREDLEYYGYTKVYPQPKVLAAGWILFRNHSRFLCLNEETGKCRNPRHVMKDMPRIGEKVIVSLPDRKVKLLAEDDYSINLPAQNFKATVIDRGFRPRLQRVKSYVKLDSPFWVGSFCGSELSRNELEHTSTGWKVKL